MQKAGIIKKKKLFAKLLLKNKNNAIEAASQMTKDLGEKLEITRDWVKDPIVKKEKERIMSSAFGELLPTKEELAFELFKLGEDVELEYYSKKGKIEAFKLYSEIMGFLTEEKHKEATNQTVMIVREFENRESFEKKLLEQQTRLMTANEAN